MASSDRPNAPRRSAAKLASLGAAIATVVGLVGGSPGLPARAATGLPAVSPRWPSSQFELGLMSSPGDASALRASAPFRFRYQYLAGGVNTGNGWSTWNPNGAFVSYYIADSVAHAMVPVFPYYMLLQSSPSVSSDEATQDLAHLADPAVMQAYWADVRLFLQRAAGSSPVVLHVEPDLWGYVEQKAANGNAATVPARVGSLGIAELAGLPDNAAGFAQAFVRLRDALAPNVILAYHLSDWGTKTDLHSSQTTDAQTDTLAAMAGQFYNSLGARFDVAFTDIADRDAAFKQLIYGDGGASWWNSSDFPRFARFFAGFTAATGERTVIWQIPLGNTKMRAMNDTWGHYQDNRVQWFLDGATASDLAMYRDAGVIALLFGGGATGTTCACDAIGDGITDPSPVDGNDLASISADDDGGYFRARAAAYYAAGPLTLAGAPAPTPTPSPSPAPTPTPAPTATPAPTPTPTPTPTPRPAGWTTGASLKPSKVVAASGTTVKVTVTVRSMASTSALVDVELYDGGGNKVRQTWFDNQSFVAGATRTFTASWQAPASPGRFIVEIGIFRPGWAGLYAWNGAAAYLTVTTS